MAIFYHFTIFCFILICFLANPAPLSIEYEDILLIIIPIILAVSSFFTTSDKKLCRSEYSLITSIMMYFCFLSTSLLMAFLHNVSLLNVLRAIGPYMNFLPLLTLAFIRPEYLNPWKIGKALMAVGCVQAMYQLYLYFSLTHLMTNTTGVLVWRITLLDPRATLPIILATAILPLAFLTQLNSESKKNPWSKLVLIGLLFISLFGAIVTLTRSIVLSIVFGWLVYILMSYFYGYKTQSKPIIPTSTLLCSVVAFVITLMLISLHPKIQLIEQGLLARFYSASYSKASDYSNGRIFDEWLPALSTWIHSDIVSLIFGIGAGSTFIVASGEERTYIHNLLIYSLVYGGLMGFISCILLYVNTYRMLFLRAIQSNQTIYIALAALLASFFFYGELFAVHKGLAFNAILCLIITMALHRSQYIRYP